MDRIVKNSKMRAFHSFLKEKEKAGKTFTAEEIADATGYELQGTVRVNLGKPVWRKVLQKVSPGVYRAIDTSDLTEEEFALRLSVKNMLEAPVGERAPVTLTERLYAKAKESFILSLELYNRPSLQNRLEAFAMLHCAAWEQLLKGKLMLDKGDDFIFRKDGRTKGLGECCEATFPQASNRIRKNIEMIADLRNMGTHLVMPELGVAYSPIFQAGVVNLLKTYKLWVGAELLPPHAVGLLTLTTGAKATEAIDLRIKYGNDLGDEVAAIINQVQFQIEADTHPEFAIVVRHAMKFASGSEADFTMEQLLAHEGRIAIVEKARDTSNDLLPSQVVAEVNRMLAEQVSLETRRAMFSYKGKVSESMNSTDFTVLCDDQSWKKSNNEYHQANVPLKRSTFTLKCVHWIVDKLKMQNDYLSKRKESFMARAKKRTPRKARR